MTLKVKSIEFLSSTEEDVYDLEIKDNHNYFAEGILVHNCHQANATCFSKFVNQLTPRYSLGLSATPKRKDCVSGDTLIYTEEGILSIREVYIKRGSGKMIRVYSKNLETGIIELKPVLEVHKKEVLSYKDIKVNSLNNILTTLDHEFI